jgi:hypothetical protein
MNLAPGPIASDAAARRAAALAAPRLARESATVAAMLRLYCRDHHAAVPHDDVPLCAECTALHDYARKRLAHCTYGPAKPTCAHCPIHCYGRQQREAMRTVMRYAGPRMVWRHPLLALAHLLDGRRPAPARPNSAPPTVDEASATTPSR